MKRKSIPQMNKSKFTKDVTYSFPTDKRFKSKANVSYHTNVQTCMGAVNVISGNRLGGNWNYSGKKNTHG